MRRFAVLISCLVSMVVPAWAASGPDERQLTDPRSIVSVSNPDARPVPIDDLFFTRSAYTDLASDLSPDGRTLLITSNERGGFDNVALLDLAKRTLTWVTDTQWQCSAGTFSRDGRRFTYTINHDGIEDAYVATTGGAAVKVVMPDGTTSPAGNPSAFAPDGKRLLLYHDDPQRPSDFWVYDIAAATPAQLTFSGIASVAPASLPPAQVVHYKTFDGRTISAILYLRFCAQEGHGFAKRENQIDAVRRTIAWFDQYLKGQPR